jgi:1-acyl-sn-glycerol-3-phosphate acyltransferase
VRFLKGTLYALILFLLFLVAKTLFRLRVRGRRWVKRGKSYIVVARHRSYWDIPFVVLALGWRNRIHFIARKALEKNPVFRPLLPLYTTRIDREHFTRADYRRALESIRRERLIGLFPEGTTKQQVDAKSGAVHFARLTGKPFLPINIEAQGPYPPRYPFGLPRVTVSIGQPLGLAELEAALDHQARGAKRNLLLSQYLMERIDAA